jgi:hypothetical protein
MKRGNPAGEFPRRVNELPRREDGTWRKNAGK